MSYNSDNMAFNNAMDSIAHYGVLGMKWGVRNEDTLRKYAGGSGNRSSIENVKKSTTGHKRVDFDIQDSDHMDSIEASVLKSNMGGRAAYKYKQDRSLNCVNCSIAFLLRDRGYDVSAKSSRDMVDDIDIDKVFKHAKINTFFSDDTATGKLVDNGLMREHKISHSDYAKLEKSLVRDFGNGASGFIGGRYAGSECAHAMAFKILDGRLAVVDSQFGKVYKDGFKSPLHNMSELVVSRTDNLKVDVEQARKHVGSSSLLSYTDNKVSERGLAASYLKGPKFKEKLSLRLENLDGEDAYINAGRDYLNNHPDSKLTLQELIDKYRNEWET